MLPLTQCLLLSIIVVGLWLYWRRNRRWSERLKGLPLYGVAYPLVGHLYQFLGDKRGSLVRGMELAERTGVLETRSPLAVWLGETPAVALFRPEDIEVLLGSTQQLDKPDLVYGPLRSLFGSGLITLNGEAWKHHRKVLTPAFHFKILERYVDIFEKHAQVLVKELGEVNGVEVNALPYMARLVSQTICETAFGMNEKLLQKEEIEKREVFLQALDVAFKVVQDRVLKPWLMVDVLFRLSSSYTQQMESEAIITKYASHILKIKKQEIEIDDVDVVDEDDSGVTKKVAFLDLVLRDRKHLLTEAEILEEVRTLVTVQQTTASTLSFILVALAIHQDVQERVLREVLEMDARRADRSYYEYLGELKYLERVIKETLRLFPVTSVFGRTVNEDLVVPSCTVPAGCLVIVHIYAIHRDKRFFGPDPDLFNPDHFLPERCRQRHPYAYIPFSAGPRNCIGQKYAMLQIKAVISTIIRSFQILPGKGCQSMPDLHMDIDTFLHIIGGFNVSFVPRNYGDTNSVPTY